VQALLVGSKRAAANRLDAKDLEEIAGDGGEVETYWLAATRNGREPKSIYRETIERAVLGEKVVKIWIRQVDAMAVRRLFPDANDLLGIWVGKRAEQYGVYNRENGS
jgi:hypothetical protein